MPTTTIDHLPTEVLSAIQEKCLPQALLDRKPCPEVAPVLLTHICSQWRTVALSNPLLWSSLNVGFITPGLPHDCFLTRDMVTAFYIEHAKKIAGPLEHWLYRSKALPFALSICFPSEVNYWQTITRKGDRREDFFSLPHAKKVVSLLQQRSRLVSLRLHDYIGDFLEGLVRDGVENLTSLSIDTKRTFDGVFHADVTPESWPKLKRLHLAPKLSTLSLATSLHPKLPLDRLTHVSLVLTGMAGECVEMLSLCHSLEQCSIELSSEFYQPESDIPTELQVVTLSKLKWLHLGVTVHVALMDFLRQLHLPSLRHISLRGLTIFQPNASALMGLPPVHPLFDPTTLTSARLGVYSGVPSKPIPVMKAVLELLQQTINLIHLELHQPPSYYLFLFNELATTSILPWLETITLTFFTGEEDYPPSRPSTELYRLFNARSSHNCHKLGVKAWTIRLIMGDTGNRQELSDVPLHPPQYCDGADAGNPDWGGACKHVWVEERGNAAAFIQRNLCGSWFAE